MMEKTAVTEHVWENGLPSTVRRLQHCTIPGGRRTASERDSACTDDTCRRMLQLRWGTKLLDHSY